MRDLAPQERQVLALISYGVPPATIARATRRSLSTIARQKGDVMARLGITSDAELTAFLDVHLRSAGVTPRLRESVALRFERNAGG
ncbi:hypothetical protein GCM10009678_19400 [Actinomadura kijaniata]|uniref:DNA-binding NarL/FixJ family response regulator n=1 Tax=Actinomadura namibiensis TaxID=182080 RepID=A0A7W3QQX0_ACTNM|nr:LuxR C-terminal-related transcriptional regulator [Actinomadura namibiensis]MBA8956185.1 DNA-binding NarL/FixJ family response regulator [Actinomadura namibiensis]